MWDLKPFSIYILCFQEKSYFFNVKFEAFLYIYSMFTRKKLYFFNVVYKTLWFKYFNLKGWHNIFLMWDLKPFSIYTLYSQEKSYIFLM